MTTQQAHIIEEAEAGQLLCPYCDTPLSARRRITQDYNGVILSCASCGFREE